MRLRKSVSDDDVTLTRSRIPSRVRLANDAIAASRDVPTTR